MSDADPHAGLVVPLSEVDPHAADRAFVETVRKYYERPRDPNDEWLFTVPLSDKELEELRVKTMAFYPKSGEFTCTGCKLAPVCSLVYDAYNTNGDCLLSK